MAVFPALLLQMWQELDSLLSAEEFVKSFCDCNESAQGADEFNDVSFPYKFAAEARDHRCWPCQLQKEQQASDVFDAHPPFQSTAVRIIFSSLLQNSHIYCL